MQSARAQSSSDGYRNRQQKICFLKTAAQRITAAFFSIREHRDAAVKQMDSPSQPGARLCCTTRRFRKSRVAVKLARPTWTTAEPSVSHSLNRSAAYDTGKHAMNRSNTGAPLLLELPKATDPHFTGGEEVGVGDGGGGTIQT